MKKEQKEQLNYFINFLKNRIGKNKIYRRNEELYFLVSSKKNNNNKTFPLWKIRQLIIKSFKNPQKVRITFYLKNEIKENKTFPRIEVQWEKEEFEEPFYLYHTEIETRTRTTPKRKF